MTREQVQNRVADARADPEKAKKMAQLARMSPKSVTARVILADLGLESIGLIIDNPDIFLTAAPSND